MGHLFSRSQGPEGDAGKKQRGTGGEVTDRDVAVLELKSTRDRVRKMRKKVCRRPMGHGWGSGGCAGAWVEGRESVGATRRRRLTHIGAPQHEEDSERFRQQAMDLLRAGNQERALMCLKLKKLRTQRLDELDTQLLNLYQLVRGPFCALCRSSHRFAGVMGRRGARKHGALRLIPAGLTAPSPLAAAVD